MFSKIGCCIEYKDITKEQKETIVEKWYDNIRILKTKLENAVFDALTEHFIIANS